LEIPIKLPSVSKPEDASKDPMILFRHSRLDDIDDVDDENLEITESGEHDYDPGSCRKEPHEYDHVTFNISKYSERYSNDDVCCKCYFCTGNWVHDLVRGLLVSLRETKKKE